METNAANYDPQATVNFGCYTEVVGCLHPHALNFNCSAPGTTNCTDAVTNHSLFFCQFYTFTTSASAQGATSAGATITIGFSSETPLTTAQISTYQDTIKAEYTAQFGAAFADVNIVVVISATTRRQLSSRRQLATSYEAVVTFGAMDADAYEAFLIGEALYGGSAAAAQAFFDAAGLDMFTVTSVSVAVDSGFVAPPPSAPPSEDVGLIVGCVVGGVVFLLILVALFFFIKKRKAKSNVAPS
jgi:hypothetical protein